MKNWDAMLLSKQQNDRILREIDALELYETWFVPHSQLPPRAASVLRRIDGAKEFSVLGVEGGALFVRKK